jgi:hypothetical protein
LWLQLTALAPPFFPPISRHLSVSISSVYKTATFPFATRIEPAYRTAINADTFDPKGQEIIGDMEAPTLVHDETDLILGSSWSSTSSSSDYSEPDLWDIIFLPDDESK